LENRSRAGAGCPHCTNKTSFNEQAMFYYARQMCADVINRAQIFGKEADIYIPSLNVVGEYDGWRHNEEKIAADVEKARHMQAHGMAFFRVREPSCAALPETVGECFNLNTLKSDEIEHAIRWFLEQIHILSPHLSVPDVDLQRDQTAINTQLTRTTRSNSIAECRPDLVEEWDWEKNGILKPDMVAKSSNRKVWWKCKAGHSWQVSPNNRMAGNNCPHCRSEKFQIIATNLNDRADQMIFASRREAAKYFNLHPSNLAKRIKSRKPLYGYILEQYIPES
jgi:very-short-patch-repair endonuclease